MVYLDAANRRIKEPIDYLIEASKKSRKLCVALALGEYKDLLADAERLNMKIIGTLETMPVEEWETGIV